MTARIVGKLGREYSPAKTEESVLEFWKTNRSYHKTKKKLAKKKKFYFLDGPPYVTNPPHVGTAYNKILKDVAIRFWRMKGFNVRDQPGFDCHGLPIELMVEKSLNLASKKDIENVLGTDRFIEDCRKYADQNVEAQTKIFKDVGVWMDWDNPYITYHDGYIESVWWTIGQAEKKKLLSKGLKVVHWCPRDETALSGYEVTDEYRIVKDHSIYVKLPVLDSPGEFILIWTTTPWTLPANEGVMVHPDETYVKVEVEGQNLILAKARLEAVLGKRTYLIVSEFPGRKLEGLRYSPPLLEETGVHTGPEVHKVVLSADYVTMTDGTGAVHTAPGHGEEDFEVGQRYGLPIFSPVDPSGHFTKEVGKYAGMQIREANDVIVEDLRRKGLLWKEETIEHSYPHCWRCKTPLIQRATEQWFLRVTSLKAKMVKENRKVKWVPEWAGSKRFNDWLNGARDWVISRQRYWGVPLPVWTCEKCRTRTFVASKAELKRIALNAPASFELHRNGVDGILVRCGNCGGTARREPDIVDVWLDSGNASWADLGYPGSNTEMKAWWPAQLIIEAHDQTRGWFYSQLGSGMVAFDRVPYKMVLMHGHALDEQGEKMSKSKGNFVGPEDVIAKFGRDALRLYTLQSTVWDDWRFSWNAAEVAGKDLQVGWNVFSFATLYMNLDKFQPAKWTIRRLWKNLRPEDKWLVSKTENLVKQVTTEMNGLRVHMALRALDEFLVEDLSHWYVRLVRRRFWQEKESRDKLAAYAVLYHALKTWVTLVSPFLPFLAERVYQDVFRMSETSQPETVHMLSWPKPVPRWINKRLEEEMRIAQQLSSAVASARQSKKLKLRQPVAKVLVVTEKPQMKRVAGNLKDLLLRQANTKELQLVGLKEEERLKRLLVEPNYKGLGPAFRQDANKVAEALREADGREVYDSLAKSSTFSLSLGDKNFPITKDMVSFKEEMPENYASGTFEDGRVYVDLTIPHELAQEGFVREMVRRLQELRKRLDLPVDAFVEAFITVPDAQRLEWLEDERDYLMEEVRVRTLHLLRPGESKWKAEMEEEWQLDGQNYRMGVART
jgi:isoleucyl-tRNA synthetase